MQDIHSRFRDVDHVADANGFFGLLDAADGLESVQALPAAEAANRFLAGFSGFLICGRCFEPRRCADGSGERRGG